jgi:hypothetical protein
MRTLKAWCSGCCHEVTVPLADVLLIVPEPDLAPRCEFRCPECGSERSVTTSDEIADTLIRAGVVAERVDVVVPSGHADGPPLTDDDEIAFGLALEAANFSPAEL